MSRRALVVLTGGAVVVALAVAVNFLGIAKLPFYTKGEPREAVVVQEMASGGGRVLPLRNGDEIPSKPPMFHWLGLLASTALGEVSELSTRVPSGILALATTLAVYLFAATTSRIRCGWLASISLLLSFEWLRAARTARVDMTFTAFFAGALLLFAWMERSGPSRIGRILFYAALVGATLTKGPIGFVLPLLIIVLYAATGAAEPGAELRSRVHRAGDVLREMRIVPGLAAVLVVTGGWYAAAWAIGGDAFLETHALRENIYRVLDADRYGSGHSHGFFYLFGQFFLGAFPWSLSAPAIAWWLWRDRPLDDTRRLLVVWFVVVFAFFLFPESKRGVYLLPAYPAGALLFGLVLGPGPEGGGQRRLAAWGWLVGSAVLALIGVTALVVASGAPLDDLVLPRLRPHEASEVTAALAALRENPLVTAAAGGFVLIAAVAAGVNAPGAHWLRASVPLVAALAIALGALVAPVERTIAQARTLAPFMPEVNGKVGDARVAFASGSFDYGAVFYAERHIPRDDASRREADYLLAFEPTQGSAPDDVVLRSSGTGARGRSHMILRRTR